MMDTQPQIELERLYHKNQTLNRLRAEFRDPRIEEHCVQKNLPFTFVVDFLAQIYLHKRATADVLIGILWRHFAPKDTEIPSKACLQECADTIVAATYSGLADYDEITRRFVVAVTISKTVQDELDRFQYPVPMVIEPNRVTRNNQTGYISRECATGSILLNNHYHEDDVCLDHINRVNKVPVSLNLRTAQMIKNQWRDLDKPKAGEEPKKYLDRVKAFEKYDRTAQDVMDLMYVAVDRFFVTNRYDARGRCYAQGYHINPQGNAWNKAVIEFADKELVSDVSKTVRLTKGLPNHPPSERIAA